MDIVELLRTVNAKQKAYDDALRLYRDRLAPAFSPFNFIKIDEMRLSGILAWMLDPEGTHGQSSKFLRLFLEKLNSTWPINACERAIVKTEWSVDEGRLDVVVSSGSRVLVIENKPWAANQTEQIRRYFNYLDRQMAGAADVSRSDFPLVYLTSDGSEPPKSSISDCETQERLDARQLHFWSYRKHILEWVAQCQSTCRADRVSTFLDEFARFIEKTFMGADDITMQNQIVNDITSSPLMLAPAMQIIFAGRAIQDTLIARLHSEVREAGVKEGWKVEGELSTGRQSGLNIDFDAEFPLFFRLESFRNDYNDFYYGALKKNLETINLEDYKAVLIKSLGRGEQDRRYLWWRHMSLHDDLLPFERYWGESSQPWVAVAEGQMAPAIINAARRFRDILSQVRKSG